MEGTVKELRNGEAHGRFWIRALFAVFDSLTGYPCATESQILNVWSRVWYSCQEWCTWVRSQLTE